MIPIITYLSGLQFTDLIFNIGCSLLATIITYVATVIFKLRIPSISNLLLWKPLANDCLIVPSEVHGKFSPLSRKGRRYSHTSLCDAICIADIFTFFNFNFQQVPNLVSIQAYADFDSVKRNNLIIVGGPKYNIASEAFLCDIDKYLEYQFKRIRDKAKRKAVDLDQKQLITSNPILSTYKIEPESDEEYGTIILTKNPYNKRKYILCLGGLGQMYETASR